MSLNRSVCECCPWYQDGTRADKKPNPEKWYCVVGYDFQEGGGLFMYALADPVNEGSAVPDNCTQRNKHKQKMQDDETKGNER